MRRISIIGGVALAALVAASAAEARCADDLQVLQSRINRAIKLHPTAQDYAAQKVLEKYAQSQSGDEVSCYNAVARARRAFDAPAQEAQEGQPGAQGVQSVQPVQPLYQQ